MNKSELLKFLSAYPLALWEEWLKALAAGGMLAAVDRAVERSVAKQQGAVVVIPVKGVILPKRSIWEQYGMATSVETLSAALKQAVADEETKAVVLDVDSPGGVSMGLTELAAEMRALRGKKPIVAHADHLAASAAYWIASQADEVIASPSALVGSIGVYSMHVDYSKALEAEGVGVTFIHAGEDKVLGNPYEPLSEEGKAYIQGLVDDTYRMFLADVAKGRGTTAANVQKTYGQGRVLTATDALAAGVVDKVRTFAETLQAYGVAAQPARGNRRAAFAREARVIDALESPDILRA